LQMWSTLEDDGEIRPPMAGESGQEEPAASDLNGAGRSCEAAFAEALQTVQELATLSSYGNEDGIVADRVDAMILGDIEEAELHESEWDHGKESSAADFVNGEGDSGSSRTDSVPKQTTEVVDARVHPEGEHSPPSACVATGPKASGAASDARPSMGVLRWLRALLLRALRQVVDECKMILALLPLVLWALMHFDEFEEQPQLSQIVLGLAASWGGARLLAALVAIALLWAASYFMVHPQMRLVLTSCFGMPLTIAVSAAFNMASIPVLATVVERSAWVALQEMPQFWPVQIWWLLAGFGRGVLLGAVKRSVSKLTSKHYDQRAEEAFRAQRLLQRIVFAVAKRSKTKTKAVKRRTKPGSGAPPKDSQPGSPSQVSPEGSVHNGVPPSLLSRALTSRDLDDRLAKHISTLAGPLEFGSGMKDAASITQARARAIRLYQELRGHSAVLAVGAEGVPATIDRQQLLDWTAAANVKNTYVNERSASALFGSAVTIDFDLFVSSIERCYKEQRLIVASVYSFDRINSIIIRTCPIAWGVIAMFFYLVAVGVDFNTLIIPSASLIISVILLAGRAPSDFASGALYVLMARPFDIGDRILISDTGKNPDLYSLVVKDVGLARTTFLTSNGEMLLIDNHLLLSKSITNLSRSGPITLRVPLKVPQSTATAKVTELVDSIRLYVAERSTDWSSVDMLFSAIDMEAGHLNLDIWVTCVHPADEVGAVYGARSNLLMFIHSYMLSAGIEYVKPILPLRVTEMPSAGLGYQA